MKSSTRLKYQIICAMYQAQLPLTEIEKVVNLNRYESTVFTRVESVRIRNTTYSPLAYTAPASGTTRMSICSKMFEYKNVVDEARDNEFVKKGIKKVCKRMTHLLDVGKVYAYEQADLRDMTRLVSGAYENQAIRQRNFNSGRYQPDQSAPPYPYEIPKNANLFAPYPYNESVHTNPFEQLRRSFGAPYDGGVHYQNAQAISAYIDEKKAEVKANVDKKKAKFTFPLNMEPTAKTPCVASEEVDSLRENENDQEKSVEEKEKEPHGLKYYAMRAADIIKNADQLIDLVHISCVPEFVKFAKDRNTALYSAHIAYECANANEFSMKDAVNVVADVEKLAITLKDAVIFVHCYVDHDGQWHDINKLIIPFTVSDEGVEHLDWVVISHIDGGIIVKELTLGK